jgi:hypothetical protein
MATLVSTGRAALAQAVKDQTIHLAWGTGSSDWEDDHINNIVFDGDDEAQAPHTNISSVVIKNVADTVTYVLGVDYTVDGATGVVTRLPAGNIAALATVRAEYYAGTPIEPAAQSALLNEVGRRSVDDVQFVVEDPDGAIPGPSGTFSVSATPTNHLFVRARFDFADAPAEIIREQGVFLGTETDPGLPPGQQYFAPGEVTNPGILLLLQNSTPLIRQPTSRETYEFVISF